MMFATSAKTSTFVAGSAAIKTTTRKSNATKRYVTRRRRRERERDDANANANGKK